MNSSKNFPEVATRLGASAGCVLLVLIAATGLPIARTYLASALFSVFLMYLAAKPRRKDLLAIAVLTPAVVMLHTWLWFSDFFRFSATTVLGGLGIATFLVLLLRAVWSTTDERREMLQIVMPAAMLTVMLFCTHNLLSLASVLSPKTMDLYLLSFDGSMGWQPSFWMGRMFHDHPWFGTVGYGAYYAILMGMGASYVLFARRRFEGISRYFMIEAFFAAGIFGFLFYQLFPATGPQFAFPGQYPFHGISAREASRLFVEPIPLNLVFMRNAVPSLHMGWALLMWWNLRNLGRLANICSFLFVVLTVLGTLGTGEHYLVDLIVAFPFALMIQAICWRRLPVGDRRRWLPMVSGLTGTLLWIAALRWGLKLFWVSPVIPWMAVLVTIGVCQYLVGRVSKWSESEIAPAKSLSAAALSAK